jgi:hypothetical protein
VFQRQLKILVTGNGKPLRQTLLLEPLRCL